MPLSSPETPQTPFGQYQLIEKIAQGGMAEIFKGKALDQEGLDRTVVIKRILPHIAASPEFVEMLIDEAKIAVMLSHGNIAQIYDLGKVAEDYFIVMEYVEGKTLSQIMRKLRTLGKQIPIAAAATICAEIANGIDYMHRKMDDDGNPLHIVHRDISPQNIIVSTAGTVKIIDFGIAKAKTKISTTDSGILKGKFAYMSPEHAEGEKLDYRTDIFSLGIVLFELLTGQRLFKGKNNAETIRKVKKSKVPTPSGIRSVIPPELDLIVFKALQRDRTKRYQSAHTLAQDLTKLLIQYYPSFSPRELVQYLHDLFPQELTKELLSKATPHPDETPLAPLLIKKEESQETHDETVAADSDLIRTKLKETEVFHLPEPEPPKPAEESQPSVVEIKERRSRIKIGSLLRSVLIPVALVLLTMMGIHFYRLLKNKKTIEPEQKISLPSPSPTVVPKIVPEVVKEPPLPPKGTLLIDSEPKGARIFLNDTETNLTTPSRLDQIPAGATHKIGLHLDRYKFWEGKVQVESGKTARLSIPLELNYGDLEINSLPVGADVILNGRMVGKTPYNLGKIPPETAYEVVLKREGYEPWSRSVKIFGGKKEVVNASLKKRVPDESLP